MMKRSFLLITLILPFVMFSSCDLLNKSDEISAGEIIAGLKTALNVGTDSSTTKLSAINGYYQDKLLKIILPPEADIILKNKDLSYFKQLGITDQIDKQIEKVILGINRAAEDAAKDAAPIFKNAIQNLTITDGLSILNGKNPSALKSDGEEFDSLAATHYLKNQTFTDLSTVFSSPINNSLDKDLGLGFSANKAWNTLSSIYNNGVQVYNDANKFGLYSNLEKVPEVSLGAYCTNKALDGLFLKVGDEEKKIRKNPYDWSIDILRKVFGSVLK